MRRRLLECPGRDPDLARSREAMRCRGVREKSGKGGAEKGPMTAEASRLQDPRKQQGQEEAGNCG